MPEPLRISSIIIAKNEAQNITRCIESQLSCIDEIIVIVDDSTTDNTEAIAQSYPRVRCQRRPWRGYAATKQYAVEQATHDWILWIDADEALRDDVQQELRDFKNTIPQHAAYTLARRAYFLGKWIRHSGWYPGRVTRLFHRAQARFNSAEVHEGLLIDGSIGHLRCDLDHYTDPDIQHYYEKFNHYTSIAANEMQSAAKRASLSDLLLRPAFLFFKMYILRAGFLDGKHGFILAVFSANYVFTKYAKLWEATRKGK